MRCQEPRLKLRACIAVKHDRLTLYCNRPAILKLLEGLEWLSKSDPSKNFEIHIGDFLGRSLDADGNVAENVWTLVEKELAEHVVTPGPRNRGGEIVELLPYDLNLMMASEENLDELEKFKATGTMPQPPDP